MYKKAQEPQYELCRLSKIKILPAVVMIFKILWQNCKEGGYLQILLDVDGKRKTTYRL